MPAKFWYFLFSFAILLQKVKFRQWTIADVLKQYRDILKGGWIGVYKSADPLKLMAESVDPLKKSTKSESSNCFPR